MKNNLELLRNKAGLSQKELSCMAGISIAGYSLLKNNNRMPTLVSAYKISTALNVSVYDIWPNEFKAVNEEIIINRVRVFRSEEIT